jgi:hypothetical protein
MVLERDFVIVRPVANFYCMKLAKSRLVRITGHMVLGLTGPVQFQSCRSRPLSIAVCSRDIFPWSAPDVAQQKLNLFQLAPSTVAETSTRPSKVVWREF